MAELKNLKKGDTVILHMFTGIAVGVKEVLEADSKTVTLETRIGTAKFSKKTGIQVEPKAKADRFANFITEDDGSFVPPERKSKKTKSTKTAKKAKSAEETEDIEEEPAPKKTKLAKAAKKSKKPEPAPEPEDDEDEDIDDDDYEEVE